MIHSENALEQIHECINALRVCVDALDSPDPMTKDVGYLVQNAHWGIKDGLERLQKAHEEQLTRLREAGIHGAMAAMGREYTPPASAA